MSFTPGTKLGSYEILEAIGAGGMGEIYRARYAKLGRDVAIKVLPEEFTQNPVNLVPSRRQRLDDRPRACSGHAAGGVI